jgi:uncharacterized protein
MEGEDKQFAGSVSSRAQSKLSGLLPDRLKAAMHKRMAAPGGAKE